MSSREQFESRFPVPEGVAWNPETSRYVLTELRKSRVHTYESHVERWVVWQASRETLVIELPNRFAEKYQDYYDDVEGGCFNEARYINDLTAAIEAAGVKVSTLPAKAKPERICPGCGVAGFTANCDQCIPW